MNLCRVGDSLSQQSIIEDPGTSCPRPDLGFVEALHEPNPLIPSFSPTGGEGARRAVEGDSLSSWSQCVSKKWRLPMNLQVGRATPCAPRVSEYPPNGGTE
jgi:hypothetical protein